MSRAGQDQAKQTFKSAQTAANTASSNAGNLYNTLTPAFTQEATNPTGIAPTDLAAMNTAGQQSAGGALAAAKGEGNLQAARSRNRGGFSGAVADSTRNAMKQGSDNALKIQGLNAQTKLQQQQEGLSGLSSTYGQNLSSLASSLGVQPAATNAYTNAGNSGWFQNMLGLVTALKPGGNVGGLSFGG